MACEDLAALGTFDEGQPGLGSGIEAADPAVVERHLWRHVRGNHEAAQVFVAEEVAGVHDGGVEFSRLDLGQQRTDVRLVGVERRLDTGEREHPPGELATRNLGGTQTDEQVVVGEVLQCGDAAGVPSRHDDLQGVGGERLRSADCPGIDQLVHDRRIRGRHDVGGRPLQDLFA